MNILIVRLSAIGDVINTLPALNTIRRHYPEARITWLVEAASAELLLGHPALDNVLISRRKHWIAGLASSRRWLHLLEMVHFFRLLRSERFDLVIDFQALMKSAVLLFFIKGKRKVGFGKGMPHAECSYHFLSERIRPPENQNIHVVERDMLLLDAIGMPTSTVEYRLPVHAAETPILNRIIDESSACGDGPLIAINPVAKWDTKLWPNEKFAALADRLAAAFNARIIFTGSGADTPVIDDIRRRMEKAAVDASGRTSLITLAALYERMAAVVSTDTGPMHLAAAVGTPVVALFGPTAPWLTGPFGDGHQVIRSSAPCAPCFKRKCSDPACMGAIGVDQVLAALAAACPRFSD